METKMMKMLAAGAVAMLTGTAVMGAQPSLASLLKGGAKKESADTTKSEASSKKSYDKVITAEAETAKGVMDIHKVKNTYYLEIPFELMGKPMLLATKVSSTSDNSDVIAGQMPGEPTLVEWSCDEDKVYLMDGTIRAVCDSAESISKGFALNYAKPVMKAFPIKAVNPDSTGVVIDVTKFFCSDESYMSPFIPASPFDGLFGISRKKGSFKSDMSSILDFKAFPKNIVFRTRMVYTVASAPFTAVVSVSMIRLPDQPMRPRLADYRIGYFKDRHVEYTEKKDRSEIVSYINRWNIAPKPEDLEKYKAGEMVEPEKPIVYYIDDAFPAEWRPYLKEGIEDWQRAFEAIGFKNAIVAKDYPKDDPDFNPDDIRYSCLRYASIQTANAMGPSWTDPRSGEIINGSVYFYHDVLKLLHNWSFIQTSAVEPASRREVYTAEQMGPLLRYLVVHEIGHTLGLMHNMRSSYAYPVDSLRSKTFTDEYGTTPSVMDYARYNYVAQPGDGVTWLLPPRLGVYDYYAISWGYKPIYEAATPEDEKPVLNEWIKAHTDDPMYWYGEQEFLSSVDPAAQTESLGDDAVKASEYGMRNLKIIMSHLDEWTAKDGENYKYTHEMYGEVLKQFNRYMGHVMKYIGGNFLLYPVHGDGKQAFEPVTKEKQKEALEFIYTKAAEMPQWLQDPDLLRKFEPSNPLVNDLQAAYIRNLISTYPKVGYTSRLAENPYTVEEYIDDIYSLVFGKTIAGKQLTLSDRNMEYAFVYSMFDYLGLLESPVSAKGFAADDIFAHGVEAIDDTWPCQHIGCGHAHAEENSLTAARRESDIKIQGKAAFYSTLLKIKKVVDKRASSAKGVDKTHYEYLAHEISKGLSK